MCEVILWRYMIIIIMGLRYEIIFSTFSCMALHSMRWYAGVQKNKPVKICLSSLISASNSESLKCHLHNDNYLDNNNALFLLFVVFFLFSPI